MRRLGTVKTKTRVAGHQDCGVCHSDSKVGRAREKVQYSKMCLEEAAEVIEEMKGEWHPDELIAAYHKKFGGDR